MPSAVKNVVNDAVTGVKHGMHSQSYTTHSGHSVPSHGYSTTQYSSVPHHISGHTTYTTGHATHQTGHTGGHATHHTGHTGGHATHHTGHTGGHATHHTGGHSVAVVSHSSNQTTRKVSEVIKGEQLVLPANAYEQSRRQVSSVIVYEEEDKIPARNVRYVEVPQYEEVIKHVPIKEIREVEKFVPKIVEEWVERIVEIPQIEEVIRRVEVPQIQEVIKHVPKIEIVDRPYEVFKNIPKVEIQKVEKVVDVQVETIEVPKAVLVEERVNISSVENRDAMLIVSQKVKPVIVDGGKEVLVDVVEYEPEVMPVDIHVAKFVEQELVMVGAKETIHRVVTVPAAQYNSMLRFLNIHLTEEELQNLPYLKDVSGQISFLPQEYEWHAPQEGLKIYGYRQGTIYGHGTPVVVHTNSNNMSDAEVRAKQAELDRQFQIIFQQFESERVRRVNAVEEFNRQQEQKVRNALAQNSYVHSGHAAISHSSHATHYPTTNYGHSTTYMPSGSRHTAGSIAYQAGHAVGSAISHRK